MKNRMKNIIKNNRIVYFILKWIYIKYVNLKYNHEVKKRLKYTIFDYYKLSKDMRLGYKEIYSSGYYGNFIAVKKYLRLKKNEPINAIIEHGIYLGDFYWDYEINNNINTIYTFSENRKKVLEKVVSGKEIVSIGPYINYVDGILSEKKFMDVKKKLGKTLVVFPTHSTHYVNVINNHIEFINEINRVRKEYKFDSVLICFYWKDIILKYHIDYINAGFEIVTAGHIYDYSFLSRLKTIIRLSDVTMTNKIGTHTGYCICLSKPHYLWEQECLYDNELVNMSNKVKDDLMEISSHFKIYQEFISKSQTEVIKKYWGEWG